jgi:hypothetical protein
MKFHRVAAVVFAVVAIAHAYRAIRGIPLVLGATAVPEWASLAGAAVAAALSVWGFRSR